jgi:R3H domain
MECLSTATSAGETVEKRELLCDEQCAMAERNKRLAEAFGIEREGASDGQTTFVYSNFLLDVYRASPNTVEKIVDALGGLMRDRHTNKYAFPTMDSMQRRMVHELASYWGMTTASGGVPPHRFVTVMKTPTSKPPPVPLSAAAARAPNRWTQSSGGTAPVALKEGATLHLKDFACEDPPLVVASAIARWQAHIIDTIWPDDANCLVIFDDANLAATARYLLTGNPFTVSTYTDELGSTEDLREKHEQEQERLAREQAEQWRDQRTRPTEKSEPKASAWGGSGSMFSVLDARPHVPTASEEEPSSAAWGADDAPTGTTSVQVVARDDLPDVDAPGQHDVAPEDDDDDDDVPDDWELVGGSRSSSTG